MTERVPDLARHFKDADRFLKSEIYKRFQDTIEKKIKLYRDRCRLTSDLELYRNQGKWVVLEEIILPLYENIRNDLKKESGSVE